MCPPAACTTAIDSKDAGEFRLAGVDCREAVEIEGELTPHAGEMDQVGMRFDHDRRVGRQDPFVFEKPGGARFTHRQAEPEAFHHPAGFPEIVLAHEQVDIGEGAVGGMRVKPVGKDRTLHHAGVDPGSPQPGEHLVGMPPEQQRLASLEDRRAVPLLEHGRDGSAGIGQAAQLAQDDGADAVQLGELEESFERPPLRQGFGRQRRFWIGRLDQQPLRGRQLHPA